MIRRALVADAAAVHGLLWSAKDDIPLKETFRSDAYIRWMRDECRKKNVWVDDHDGQIAGMAMLDTDEIRYLAVAIPFRKLGIGARLVGHAQSVIKRKYRSEAYARANPRNLRIVRLLERLGFEVDDNRPVVGGWVWYRGPKQIRTIERN
jgi:ribosomal protein S18 acetylase RimI-like enzyme